MSEAQQVVIDREWMRARLFGSDEAVIGSQQAFQAHIIGVCERAASRLETLAFAMHLRAYLSARLSHHGVPGLVAEELATSIRTVRRSGEEVLVALSQLHSRSAERPFRVVLMGRTMAGKSTLFEFLSAGDGARVGDGRQRFTRDACVRHSASMGIDFVDTPGVGAMDGMVDFRVAFEQIPDADLVLWVATDQATQEQTGRALEGLGDMGKPIIVALNCLNDINDEIGLFDLVNEPERVFGGDAVGNLAPIDRHLARAGAKYLDAIPIHAQAALSAATDGFDGETARTLLRNSRIAHLVEVLESQRDRTAPQRRVVSVCDAARLHLLEAGSALAAEEVRLRSIVEASKLASCDFERRARRRIDDANSELEAAFTDAVARRERWVETVDVDQKVETINESWRAEVQLLEGEIVKVVHDAAKRLNEDLHAIAADVADDWSAVKPGIFGDLGGYGEAWGNRALKVGGRLGLIAIGALLGSTIPVLGPVMGALVGGLISAAVQLPGAKAWDWVVDRLFRSPEQVRARRRTQVRNEFVPLIDGLRNSLTELRIKVVDSWGEAIETDRISRVEAMVCFEESIEVLSAAYNDVGAATAEIDTELARELLRLNGRGRAASSVTRATRWRGAGMAVEVPEPVFSELVLFPVTQSVETIAPVATGVRPAVAAAHLVRGLNDCGARLVSVTVDEVRVAVPAELSPGVREAWETLASVHTTVRVRIQDGERK